MLRWKAHFMAKFTKLSRIETDKKRQMFYIQYITEQNSKYFSLNKYEKVICLL